MNRTGFVATLSLSALLFVGCGGDSGRVASIGAPRGPVSQPLTGDLEDLDYEVFTGTLMPGQSGGMYDFMTTWGAKNCLVSLIVPVESMPELGEPTTFTVSLPTKASYLAHPEFAGRLIVRLAPDGMLFRGPIHVQATWMPWEPAPPDTFSMCSGGDCVPAYSQYVPSINRYRVTFSVNHFSDWESDPEPPLRYDEPVSALARPNAW